MSETPALTAARRVLMTVFVLGMLLGSLMSVGRTDFAWVFVPAAVCYGLVGLAITGHRPRNPVGWVFLGAGAAFSTFWLTTNWGARIASESGSPPLLAVILVLVANMLIVVFLVLCTTFTVLLYPDGLPSPRWRPLLWASGVATLAVTLSHGFASPVQVVGGTGNVEVANPLFGATLVPAQNWIGSAGGAVIAVCSIAGVVSAVARTWRSTGVQRLQMRWFAASVALVLVLPILVSVLGAEWGFVAMAVAVALPCVPTSCGVAILRYRLYEIDRIISRTLSYGLVTGLLLAIYLVVVTSLTQLLPGTSNSFAVAAATLAAAALFRPVLARVRATVDRRFNRSRYDAQRTVEQFAGRLRDEVSAEQVTVDLVKALNETLQPSAASLWLRDAP